uniref:Uncharacterized protein n=1 Tax=Anopheles maculatus TaxID=74869 RepID=A0A182SME0_9DIPT
MEQHVQERIQRRLTIVYRVLSDDGRAGPSGVNVAKTAPRFGSASVSEALQLLKYLHSGVFRLPQLPYLLTAPRHKHLLSTMGPSLAASERANSSSNALMDCVITKLVYH